MGMILKIRQILLVATLVTYAITVYPSLVFPFATSSHREINGAAVQGSQSLHPYLKDVLGFTSGLDTRIKNNRGVDQPIIDWIGDGGVAEDELYHGWLGDTFGGLTRSKRHFHQPLRPWDQAGLWGSNESSVRWAQSPNQEVGRKASWFDGRDSYLNALLAPTQQDRDANFAETFQTIGQEMHLVADGGSVPHVRDDAHPLLYTFEGFVENNPYVITGSKAFDTSMLQESTGDSIATVPIARLWDTETYNGTNPPGDADTKIGIAEFTNANFFSRDTIIKTAYSNPELPLPAIDRLDPLDPLDPEAAPTDPRTGKPAIYLSKNRDGVKITHMVRVSAWSRFVPFSFYFLDDRVYENYAKHLLPRAIGYAAGIPAYFFRGTIKIEAPDRFVYALADYEEGNTGSFTKMRFKVSNDTQYPNTSENTDGAGQMWAVVRYRVPLSGNLFENPRANLSEPIYAVSEPQSVDLSRTPQEITFDFTGANTIPTNSADVFLWAVWQGKLGLEDGAVMVGAKDLFEPAPLTFGNATDYDCFQQTLYHVADLTAFPPYNFPTQTQRDVSQDGIQDIFGPFIDYDHFIKTYDLSKPLTASPSLFDFKVAQFQATKTNPQYSRFVLLQDQASYAFSWRIGSFIEVPSGYADMIPRFYNFSVDGLLNDFELKAGQTVRRVTPNFIYRGIPTFCFYLMVVEGYAKFNPCLSNSYSLPEPFIRLQGELAPE